MWTDERVAELKRLAQAGRTASQIAQALGGVTRNGVIGKLARLNMRLSRPTTFWTPDFVQIIAKMSANGYSAREIAETLRQMGKPATTVAVRDRLARLKMVEGRRLARRELRQRRMLRQPIVADSPSLALQVPILNAAADQCRYIIGDVIGAETFYCGAPQRAGSSYCPYHHARCYSRVPAPAPRVTPRHIPY